MSETADTEVLDLAKRLMAARSVTPDDAGCQDMLAAHLHTLGFQTERIDQAGVSNLWASLAPGNEQPGPHLLFAGHTDVVPPGPLEAWSHDPFEPVIIDDHLCGRGAADMKASLAAMIAATRRALADGTLQGTLSFLITSDEEGDALHGTRHAIAQLHARGVRPDYCVVGEPSSTEVPGDVVRCGRRGSLNGRLIVHGTQGHVAYPQDALNPIHSSLGALQALTATEWDSGNEFYPPTSLQISNVASGTGATNVIPGEMTIDFNFRYSTQQTAAGLVQQVERLLTDHGLRFTLDWKLSGEPFLTRPGQLTAAVTEAVQTVMGIEPELSTSGGTSDGRFIAPWHGRPPVIDAGLRPQQTNKDVEVVELGPTNATIHKIDERIPLRELGPLAQIYQHIIRHILQP